jgi:hypothetical protein
MAVQRTVGAKGCHNVRAARDGDGDGRAGAAVVSSRPHGGAAEGGRGHGGRAHRARLQLLARRQGQLRRRPGGGRARDLVLSHHSGQRPRAAGVPRPCRQLPGRRGRHPAVPRCRHRAAHGQQHARGRPAGGAGFADRVRRQRPDRARARPGPAGQRLGGRDRLPGRGPAQHVRDPGRGGEHARLQPADRGDADRGLALHPRLRRPGRPPRSGPRRTGSTR